jgi:hypothetical protein
MRRTYVYKCDLQVVMKADRSSDFGLRRWFPLHHPPSRRSDHTSGVKQ